MFFSIEKRPSKKTPKMTPKNHPKRALLAHFFGLPSSKIHIFLDGRFFLAARGPFWSPGIPFRSPWDPFWTDVGLFWAYVEWMLDQFGIFVLRPHPHLPLNCRPPCSTSRRPIDRSIDLPINQSTRLPFVLILIYPAEYIPRGVYTPRGVYPDGTR